MHHDPTSTAKPERLLITGGCGFIGSNLVRMAIRRGHHVTNVDALTYAGHRESLADVAADPNYQFAHVDLRDAGAVDRIVAQSSPDVILHLAAESHVDRSIAGPQAFIQTNIVGTFHLLQSAMSLHRRRIDDGNSPPRLVHVSTDEVYGSLGPTGRFDEHTKYDPHSPYAASKAASDHLVAAWHDTYQLQTVVTHCSNNYGPYQYPEKLIPVVIQNCIAQTPIPVYGDGSNVRDWIHVDDHCEALLTVARHGRPGEIYDIGADEEQSNLELIRTICRIMDQHRPRPHRRSHAELIQFVSDRPGHDWRYAIKADKIRQQLGWKPRHCLRDGLAQTIRWYLDNPDWIASVIKQTTAASRPVAR